MSDGFPVHDGFGNDTLSGGTDDDVIDLSALTGPVTVNYTGDEAGTITDGTDRLFGATVPPYVDLSLSAPRKLQLV